MTISNFRVVALAETVSWLALLVAMVAKYGFGNDAGVSLIGPVHGVIVLVYALFLLNLKDELGIDWATFGSAIVATVIPFGASLMVERKLVTNR